MGASGKVFSKMPKEKALAPSWNKEAEVISTCQHVDQHLSAASLATVRQLISTCQLLDQHL